MKNPTKVQLIAIVLAEMVKRGLIDDFAYHPASNAYEVYIDGTPITPYYLNLDIVRYNDFRSVPLDAKIKSLRLILELTVRSEAEEAINGIRHRFGMHPEYSIYGNLINELLTAGDKPLKKKTKK